MDWLIFRIVFIWHMTYLLMDITYTQTPFLFRLHQSVKLEKFQDIVSKKEIKQSNIFKKQKGHIFHCENMTFLIQKCSY